MPDAPDNLAEKDASMSDTPRNIRQRRKLISLNEDHEVRDWCKSLGCTEEQLRVTVQAVGRSDDKIREYVKNNWEHIKASNEWHVKRDTGEAKAGKSTEIKSGESVSKPTDEPRSSRISGPRA